MFDDNLVCSCCEKKKVPNERFIHIEYEYEGENCSVDICESCTNELYDILIAEENKQDK